jgi:hypothetical protein
LFYPDAEPNEISNESNRPEVSTLWLTQLFIILHCF